MSRLPERLSDYPYVIVRFSCIFCPTRRGVYRLARLAERFGAEASLDLVRETISANCPRRRTRGNQYVPRCHAWFTDIPCYRNWDVPNSDR